MGAGGMVGGLHDRRDTPLQVAMEGLLAGVVGALGVTMMVVVWVITLRRHPVSETGNGRFCDTSALSFHYW